MVEPFPQNRDLSIPSLFRTRILTTRPSQCQARLQSPPSGCVSRCQATATNASAYKRSQSLLPGSTTPLPCQHLAICWGAAFRVSFYPWKTPEPSYLEWDRLGRAASPGRLALLVVVWSSSKAFIEAQSLSPTQRISDHSPLTFISATPSQVPTFSPPPNNNPPLPHHHQEESIRSSLIHILQTFPPPAQRGESHHTRPDPPYPAYQTRRRGRTRLFTSSPRKQQEPSLLHSPPRNPPDCSCCDIISILRAISGST